MPKSPTYKSLIDRWNEDDGEGVVIDDTDGEGELFDLTPPGGWSEEVLRHAEERERVKAAKSGA